MPDGIYMLHGKMFLLILLKTGLLKIWMLDVTVSAFLEFSSQIVNSMIL